MPHDENGTQTFTKREIFAGRSPGKGDQRRPHSVSGKEFADNWARIFGKPARPGRQRKICGPIQWTPCPRCKHVTSFDFCSNCGDLLPAQKHLDVVGSNKCRVNAETKS